MAQGSGEMRQNVVECRACWGKGYKTKRRTSGFEHYFKMRAKVRESAARRSSLCKHLSVKAYLRICGRWKVVVGGTCVCKGKLKVNIGWFFEYRCQARSQQRRSFLMKLTELTDAHIYECFSGGQKRAQMSDLVSLRLKWIKVGKSNFILKKIYTSTDLSHLISDTIAFIAFSKLRGE